MYNMQPIPEPTTELYDFGTTMTDVLNTTMDQVMNGTNGTSALEPTRGSGLNVMRVALKVAYALGIIGNAAAIVALRRGERRVRNRKHLLLLTSLAANDLVALVGMMAAMLASEGFAARGAVPHWYCCARVVLRVFGVGSVCIAVTMALERYLALTRPFLYQKQVTYYVIRTALLASWLWAAALTCAPMLGVGLYYDAAGGRCARYREATAGVDFGYAVFYVVFGTLLCAVLVYCNLAVIRALYAVTAPRVGGPPVVRRVSKSSCRQRSNTAHAHHNAATAEEVAFSRLMATLSVLFMLCWLPQMSSCRQRSNTAHAHHNAATAEEVAFSRLMATLSVLFMLCWLPQMVRLLPVRGDGAARRRAARGAARVQEQLPPAQQHGARAPQRRHGRGGGLQPPHGHALRALHALLAAADGDVGAVPVDEGDEVDGDAEQAVGRADAAQLRAGPRAVRADAAAAPGVRRHAVPLHRGLLQKEPQNIDGVHEDVVLPAGDGGHQRQLRRRDASAAAARLRRRQVRRLTAARRDRRPAHAALYRTDR